jgi:ArsR family transcriptional regulator
MFRALSDPTRLRIVHLLRDGPLCVGDLVTVLRVAQPTASRHLAYLRRVGLVVDERRGTWMFYGLAEASAPFHRKLLECVAAASDLVAQTRRDDAALAFLRQKGGCCPQHERGNRVMGERQHASRN